MYKLVEYPNKVEEGSQADWNGHIEDGQRGYNIYRGPYSFHAIPYKADAEKIVDALNLYEERKASEDAVINKYIHMPVEKAERIGAVYKQVYMNYDQQYKVWEEGDLPEQLLTIEAIYQFSGTGTHLYRHNDDDVVYEFVGLQVK